MDEDIDRDLPVMQTAEENIRICAYEAAENRSQPNRQRKQDDTSQVSRPKRVPVDARYSWHLSDDGRYSSDSQELYIWNGVHWGLLDRRHAESDAQAWLTENYVTESTARKAADCVRHAINTLFRTSPLPTPSDMGELLASEGSVTVIPLKDRYAHVRKEDTGTHVLCVKEPAREYGLQYCISAKSDAIASGAETWLESFRTSDFKTFLDEILPLEDIQNLVQEYIGYTLMPDTRYQIAQVWIGSGQNGKGALKQIVGALHAKHSSANLNNLSGFALEPLIEASLVSVDEVPRHGIDEQQLKTLISGDQTPADRKNRTAINFSPKAKWIICCNELPHSKDQSYGFWRRFQIIRFGLQLNREQVKPGLAQTIIAKELDIVLRWAMEGLLRLLNRGHFPHLPSAVLDELRAGRIGSDSTLAWSEDREVQVSENRTEWGHTKEEIYNDYKLWCKENGVGAVASNHFWQRLSKQHPTLNLNGTRKDGRRQTNMNVNSIEIRKREIDRARRMADESTAKVLYEAMRKSGLCSDVADEALRAMNKST